MRSKGAYAVSVESIYPSLTNPAHATIATGALPSDHGITADFPFNDQSGTQSTEPYSQAKEIKNETIWDAAKRGGFITGAVGFPLTAGAGIDFNLPAVVEDTTFTVNPFLKDIARYQRTDQARAVSAVQMIEKQRPNLMMVSFASYEVAVRKYGPQSKEAIIAIEFIDSLIKKIIDATERAQLTNDLTIFIVSDYGSMKIESIFNPNVVLAKKGWLTTDSKGQITTWRAVAQSFGGSAAIFVKGPEDEKMLREIEKLFSEFYDKPDSPIWRVLTRREASQLGADHRPAIYLDAAPLYAMSSRATGPTITRASERASHGYLPSRSEMRAVLVIFGKGIKYGAKIEYARLIDIAPTVARLLGLEMRTARGRVLSEVIIR